MLGLRHGGLLVADAIREATNAATAEFPVWELSSQVDELRDRRPSHTKINHLRTPTDPKTLPGTVARTGDDEEISARTVRIASNQRNYEAGATGLEPATSGVTGRRSNQLSYAPSGGTFSMPSRI